MNNRRVLAIGVFDLFHVGHLRYLQYVRKQGSHMSVAISRDEVSLATKGKLPVIPQAQRMEMIQGLGWVDTVRLQPCSTLYATEAAEWIAQWEIDLVVGGGEWHGSARWTRLTAALAERGIAVSFAPYTDEVSSTQIIEQIRAGR